MEVSFWKPVDNANTETFAKLNKPVTRKKGKENHLILNSDRQLWRRLAIVPKTHEIDSCDVLSYKLSLVPLTLCNLNGTLWKPDNAALLHELEVENQGFPMIPDSSRKMFIVLDIMALVQSITKGKKTMCGQLADSLCDMVLSPVAYSACLHVVPDRYDISDSIEAEGTSQENHLEGIRS